MALADNVSLFPGETTEDFDPNVMLGAGIQSSVSKALLEAGEE